MATSIKLDAALQDRVRHLAEHEREEKRESFKQEAMQAWQAYQATGLHVTHEEMDAYLAKLEAGEDAEPPRATTHLDLNCSTSYRSSPPFSRGPGRCRS